MESAGCWKFLEIGFQIVCTLGAAVTVFWCGWEYSKNDDVVEVAFKKFGDDPDSIYPVITLCFESPLSEEKLKLYGDEISKAKYQYFLSGQYFDKRMLDVDYETVSLELKRHLLGAELISTSTKEMITHDRSVRNHFFG